MTSTSRPEGSPGRAARRVLRPLAVLVWWLAVWQLAAVVVGQRVLLVGPVQVAGRLAALVVTADFWVTVARTTGRVAEGFALAAVAGIALAAAAAASSWVEAVVGPAIAAIRSTPVVSFIILVLIWAEPAHLATIVSFLMTLPIVHATVLEGIRQRDRDLLEMARVFEVRGVRRLLAVDVPAVLPYFVAACHTGVGLAWKSGIAAEVIGLPVGTIGERLYQAKVFLATGDVLAWTVVVVVVAYACERLVRAALVGVERRLAVGMSGPAPQPGVSA